MKARNDPPAHGSVFCFIFRFPLSRMFNSTVAQGGANLGRRATLHPPCPYFRVDRRKRAGRVHSADDVANSTDVALTLPLFAASVSCGL